MNSKYFYLALIFIAFSSPSFSNEKKILILVISSRDHPVYEKLEQLWRTYIHSDQEHVEAYFLRSDPDLDLPYKIDGDVFWSKNRESLWPGIIEKTLGALDHFLPRMDEFNYIVRTNLSSFFVIPRLIDFVSTLPKNRCYCGVINQWKEEFYVSGAGIILSADLAKLLVINRDQIPEFETCWDDVVIGKFMANHLITPISAPRRDITCLGDWHRVKKSLLRESEIFHYRLKQAPNLRSRDEVDLYRKMIRIFKG